MARLTATLSLTETDQFRRLVVFLEAVEAAADERCDIELKGLVEDCRADLLELRGD